MPAEGVAYRDGDCVHVGSAVYEGVPGVALVEPGGHTHPGAQGPEHAGVDSDVVAPYVLLGHSAGGCPAAQ